MFINLSALNRDSKKDNFLSGYKYKNLLSPWNVWNDTSYNFWNNESIKKPLLSLREVNSFKDKDNIRQFTQIISETSEEGI